MSKQYKLNNIVTPKSMPWKLQRIFIARKYVCELQDAVGMLNMYVDI